MNCTRLVQTSNSRRPETSNEPSNRGAGSLPAPVRDIYHYETRTPDRIRCRQSPTEVTVPQRHQAPSLPAFNSAPILALVLMLFSVFTAAYAESVQCEKTDCPKEGNGAELMATSSPARGTTERLRLRRIESPAVRFDAPPAGLALRWLRNMRKPPFCPYALCHGTCSSVTGKFATGESCAPTESADLPGPCSLRPVDFFAETGGGCCGGAPGTISEPATVGVQTPECCH